MLPVWRVAEPARAHLIAGEEDVGQRLVAVHVQAHVHAHLRLAACCQSAGSGALPREGVNLPRGGAFSTAVQTQAHAYAHPRLAPCCQSAGSDALPRKGAECPEEGAF